MGMSSSGSCCHRRSRSCSSYSSCEKLKIGFIGEKKTIKNKKLFQKYQKATIKKLFWKSSKKKTTVNKKHAPFTRSNPGP